MKKNYVKKLCICAVLSALYVALELLSSTIGKIAFLDGYQIPINPKIQEDKKKYILDGLHPNTEGHKLYAEYVIERIKLYETGRI